MAKRDESIGYQWNTPYNNLSETLRKIHDAEDKMFSVTGNLEKWDKGDTLLRHKMIDDAFRHLGLAGKLTEEELEYLTEINAHSLRAYLEGDGHAENEST